MPERVTADTLAARLDAAVRVGTDARSVARDAIAHARSLEGLTSAQDESHRRVTEERDEARAAREALRLEYASMQQRWLDQRKVSVGLRYDVEVAQRERDEARAVAKEVEAEAFCWKDEAAEAVERNAVISEERNDARAEVERLRTALREAEDRLGDSDTASARYIIASALGDG